MGFYSVHEGNHYGDLQREKEEKVLNFMSGYPVVSPVLKLVDWTIDGLGNW